ncbi:phosphoglycolate phosphatase [Mucilaginibacter mallensis]|uniref:phosphoglycolate phosphatase n=1 Tax=Mucilaginibacter mallensis TaxID=652787 RepID=A0A1H2AQS3_MUCMA|nr:HAD family hydrolase [Mucilaginibacter mallensis]SDT47896.1 phosphoglycolate phosphatase [Mucilaginibacter mallensis]
MNNSLNNKFDSIIFDLDGTLWDSTANVAVAWQAAKNEVDYIDLDFTQETIRSITGMTYKAIFEKLLPLVSDEQRNAFKSIAGVKEIEILQRNGGHLYPQLEETLAYLVAKYKLFVVSNCQNDYIETFLEFSQLGHYFSGHQCYGTKSRPKAENIKDIVNDHQLTAPVYVGDTMGDYESSTKAGVPFIFASYGFGVVETGQIATINTLSDLVELL